MQIINIWIKKIFNGATLIPLFLLLVWPHCAPIDEMRQGEVRVFQIAPGGHHFSLTAVSDGTLLAVQTSGNQTGVRLLRSTDRGLSWMERDVVWPDQEAISQPVIASTRERWVLMHYGAAHSADSAKKASLYFSLSRDGGNTFQPGQEIPLPGLSHPVLNSGAVITPFAWILPFTASVNGASPTVLFLISRDEGGAWKEIREVPAAVQKETAFSKPSLTWLPDGRFLCLMERAGDDVIYQSISADSGRTWSAAEPTSLRGRSPGLAVTAHGTVLCAFLDTAPRGVSMARSFDFATSWESKTPLYDFTELPMSLSVAMGPDDFFFAVFPMQDGLNGLCLSARPLPAPRGLSASWHPGKGVRLRWNKMPGAAYYLIYRDTKGPAPQNVDPLFSSSTTDCFDAEADSGRVYFYSVSSVRGTGPLLPGTGSESALSRSVRVETLNDKSGNSRPASGF